MFGNTIRVLGLRLPLIPWQVQQQLGLLPMLQKHQALQLQAPMLSQVTILHLLNCEDEYV